jgi:hypothetical protein
MKKTKTTREQRDILERILQGESADSFFKSRKAARHAWSRWANSRRFREALADTVDRKEMVETMDALTLNRRVYNKLLTASAGDAGSLDGQQVRILLVIVEAMARRLTELKPRLQAMGPVAEEILSELPGPTPEECKALAEALDRMRHEKEED